MDKTQIIDYLERVMVPVLIVFIPAFISYLMEVKKAKLLKKENAALKAKVHDLSLPIQYDLEFFNLIRNIVETIFRSTKADRFLILSATNGVSDLRFTSVVYEQHKQTDKVMLSFGAVEKYKGFEFDDEYRKMLKLCEVQGAIVYNTDTLKPSDLKRIYQMEQVKHSIVKFICRVKIDESNDRVFYCSISTHDLQQFTDEERMVIRLNISKLRHSFISTYKDLIKKN